MLDLILALACLALAAVLVAAFWCATREPKRLCADCVAQGRGEVPGKIREHTDGLREALCDACWSRHVEPPRGLDPVTITDGEVEEIGGGAR